MNKLFKFNSSKLNFLIRSFQRNASNQSGKNVAMILSGCGVYDGSEIIESTSCAIHLSRNGANVDFYAPNIEQMHVINHLTGEVLPETRNVLQESARIARGKISPLTDLHANKYSALVIPGGFGAAKNLCDFATRDTQMTVNKEVERAIREFILNRKPIGLCCIAPVIIAKLYPECEITVGLEDTTSGKWPYASVANSVKLMGSKNVPKDVNEVQIDRNRLIVTTPAFMKEAKYHEVFEGIGKMIDALLKL